MLAAVNSYPLLDAFWTILWFFLFVIWIWILIMVIFDVFRSHDLGGWAKALWLILILFLPYLGVLIYLIARGGSMHERSAKDTQQEDQEFRTYVQQTAVDTPADQLSKLAALKDRGVISQAEFDQQKAKILA